MLDTCIFSIIRTHEVYRFVNAHTPGCEPAYFVQYLDMYQFFYVRVPEYSDFLVYDDCKPETIDVFIAGLNNHSFVF